MAGRFSKDVLETILKRNLSSYHYRQLDKPLIDKLTVQILDSLDFYLSKSKQKS